MRPRLRAAAANLALAALSVALTLLAAELALRLLARPQKGGKEQLERNTYTEYDPLLGWRKTPGAHVVYDRRDYHVEYRVNSLGLRGPERPYAKPSGVRRVLALGDSFVEAFMVKDEETVTSRLEADLGEAGCRAQVINGGTLGYSSDQEYLFYREEGRKYAPDVVVLFVYYNDVPYLVLDHYLPYPKPVLEFDTEPPQVVNAPVPRYVPVPPTPEPPQPEPTSYLFAFVQDHMETLSPKGYNALARLGLWPPLRRLALNDELRLFRVPEMGHLRPAWSAFTYVLEALSKAVRADGARLVIAYVPSRMEVNDRVWELTRARYGLDEKHYDRFAVAGRVRYIAGRLRLPFLDLTPPLAKADGLLTPAYFATDSHWNARGQQVAARALRRYLLSNGDLAGCR